MIEEKNIYVGNRYVPKIMGEWHSQEPYEGLSIVTFEGTSYTSKKGVPIGVNILNEDYWVVTGNYNAQIENYRQEVRDVKNNLSTFESDTSTIFLENEELRKKTLITPYDFNAVGDGIADDTIPVREALYESHIKGTVLFFPSGCKCLVNDTLNVHDDVLYDITLNIKGSLPNAKSEYALTNHGGIKTNNSIALFKKAEIKGSINNMSFIGKRQNNIYFFDSCELSGFNLSKSNIANFEAFAYDTNFKAVCLIDTNMFLSVSYFHKQVSGLTGITDSFIKNNYINGGAEPTDNACFEFIDGNGSVIEGNFIDYYHTIFRSKLLLTNQLPTSIGNQYQVFLYFYDLPPETSTTIVSIGDTFNWTDSSKLPKLTTYVKHKYLGVDGIEYEIPSYVFRPINSGKINIRDAYIQSNVGNLVYIDTGFVEYENHAKVNFVGVDKYKTGKLQFVKGNEKPFFNKGLFANQTIEPYFVLDLAELPLIYIGQSKYPNGTRIRVKNQDYRMLNKYNQVDSVWETSWVEVIDY